MSKLLQHSNQALWSCYPIVNIQTNRLIIRLLLQINIVIVIDYIQEKNILIVIVNRKIESNCNR